MVEKSLTLSLLIRMYPNATMRKFINKCVIYRNELWNRCLKQRKYDYRDCKRHIKYITFVPKMNKHKKVTVKEIKHYNREYPSWHVIRKELTDRKTKMDYLYPSSILDGVSHDLNCAYEAFFDPNQPDVKFPKIKHKNMNQGSFIDKHVNFRNGKVHLSSSKIDPKRKKYTDIKLAEFVPKQYQNKPIQAQIMHRNKKYYILLHIKRKIKQYMPTGQTDGVDVNVGHFNSAGVCLNILPKSLNHQYNKIKCYDRQMAHKRNINGKKQGTLSKNYKKVQFKLEHTYKRIHNIQTDIVKKYANYLTRNRDRVTIEDLNVKSMLMSHVASSGVHRSMFSYFKDTITYMGKLYGCKIIFANRLFASTQECPRCHHIKIHEDKITLQGNKEHGTKHNQFVCYNCGYTADRDDSAYQSLANYDGDDSYAWYREIRKNEENKWEQSHSK